MHHCLQIYDMLTLICEASLYRKHWENNECVLDRPSLFALLKTCPSFSIPAAKLLWRNLPSLVPLIFAMPEHLLEVKTFFEKVEELGELRYSQVGPQTVVRPLQLAAFWFNLPKIVSEISNASQKWCCPASIHYLWFLSFSLLELVHSGSSWLRIAFYLCATLLILIFQPALRHWNPLIYRKPHGEDGNILIRPGFFLLIRIYSTPWTWRNSSAIVSIWLTKWWTW